MMGVTLTQSSLAAFPDRTGSANLGVLVTMTNGSGSSKLVRALAAFPASQFVRLMLAPRTVSGGTVEIARGVDDADATVWSLTLRPATSQLRIAADGESADVSIAGRLEWICVEIEVDATNGVVSLSIDHVAGTTLTSLSLNPVSELWLGAVSRENASIGTLAIDEVKVATRSVGPVIVECRQDHAGDARRWVMLYNTELGTAQAQAYRDLRGVPYANCVGLALGTNEQIAVDDLEDRLPTLLDYVARHLPGERIRGVVMAYGVPGMDDAGRSVQSWIAGTGANAMYVAEQTEPLTLPGRSTLGRVNWLTAELNAPSSTIASALPTRADALIEERFDGQRVSKLRAATDKVLFDAGSWADCSGFQGTLAAQQIRLPLATVGTHGHAVELLGTTSGTWPSSAARRALVVCGADSQAAAVRGTAAVAGKALAAGYAAVIAWGGTAGVINLFSLSAALRAGWTLAEALRVSLENLTGSWRLVGDPLAIMPWPKSGYEVRSRPVRSGDETLLAVKPAGSTSATLTGLPSSTEFWLRIVAVDRLGQADQELRLVRMRTTAGGTVRLPAPNAPVSLALVAIVGGRLRATWGYIANGQAAEPAGFRLYVGLDGADPDWSMSVQSIGYAALAQFSAVIGPYAEGRSVAVGVRSVSAQGGLDDNRLIVRCVARAVAPASSLLSEAEVSID